MKKPRPQAGISRYVLPAAVFGLYLIALLILGRYQEQMGLYYVLTTFGFGLLVCAWTVCALALTWNSEVKQALFHVAAVPLLLLAVFFCIGLALPKTQIRADESFYVVERVQTSAVFLLSFLRFALVPAVTCAAVVCCRRATKHIAAES